MTVVQTIPKYNKYCSLFSKKNRIYLLIIKWEEYIKYSTSLTRNPLVYYIINQNLRTHPLLFLAANVFLKFTQTKKKELQWSCPLSHSHFLGERIMRNGRERVELKAKEYCVPPPPPLGFSPPPTAFKNDATCL